MFKKLFAALALVAMGAFTALPAFAAVDANKATQAELETVKGIGPGISAKIVEERKKGAFKDWQDMVERIKGVGRKVPHQQNAFYSLNCEQARAGGSFLSHWRERTS